MSSDLLFRSLCCSGYVMMASFSCKQIMHLFVVLLYAGACFRIPRLKAGRPSKISTEQHHENLQKSIRNDRTRDQLRSKRNSLRN